MLGFSSSLRRLNYGSADYDIRHSFGMNYVGSDAFRHLTNWGPNTLVKGWTVSGTIFKHTGFPYSIRSSNETAALQGRLLGSSNPATTNAVLANLVGTPNLNCGASAAQLVNGQITQSVSQPTTINGSGLGRTLLKND
jgi:hypothetical protein